MVTKFSLKRMLTYKNEIDEVNLEVLIEGYEEEGPVLYKITPPGILEVGQSFYIGSDSSYAACMMEICLKKKGKGHPIAEVVESARNAIHFAAKKDIFTTVYHLSKDGIVIPYMREDI
ncbi:OLC1v1014040C1 [Oldenlandia corymbosa var. corymbosa]|uniref:OLC1v1014040C1 n=1 Tax=Oldenlandia corymbosa var. corymbosa TaxID=529605 RepID=A0AAV1E297_OLDCO|nr:OLC1v1014040C1 [Oldenlandia corymbosa var. corymbosa]